MRRRCRTPGCVHFTREGLRGSGAFHQADGEYCWRCRRQQNLDPRDRDVSFFAVGQHDVPDPVPSAEQTEAELRAAWGPVDGFRHAVNCPDDEFERLRAGPVE